MNTKEFIASAWKFLKTFEWPKIMFDDDFRATYRNPQKRSAEQIIASRFFMGCFEPAFVLWTMANGQGIPVRFVGMIDITRSFDDYRAHYFIELYDNETGIWIKTDPTRMKVLDEYPAGYMIIDGDPFLWTSFNETEDAYREFLRKNQRK